MLMRFQFEKLGSRRPFRKLRYTWENSNEGNFKGVGCEVMDWIYLTQNRVQFRGFVRTVINLWVLYKAGSLFPKKDATS
jgi:hypothetical protein